MVWLFGGLLIFTAWREYLHYRSEREKERNLYRLIDDLFDRKNAGDFDKYTLGKRLKNDIQIPMRYGNEEPEKPNKIKMPVFLNKGM